MAETLTFHLIMAVWGKEHTELFLNVALASQLAGHVDAFNQRGHSAIYRIYTKEDDVQRIRNSSGFHKLSDVMPVEINIIPAGLDNYEGSFQAMTYCHQDAIRGAWESGSALIFLVPDTIFSENTFPNVVKAAETGVHGVVIAGVRVAKETFVPVLLERHAQSSGTISLKPRELVKLAVEHLHPISQSYFLDSPVYNARPSHLYWHVSGEGILIRAFHQHPLMLRPRRLSLNFGSIDLDYFSAAGLRSEDFYVPLDSDELTGFEMSPSAYQSSDLCANTFNTQQLAHFMLKNSFGYHRSFFTRKVRLHYTDISDRWGGVEHASDQIVLEIFAQAVNVLTGQETESGTVSTTAPYRWVVLVQNIEIAVKSLGYGAINLFLGQRGIAWTRRNILRRKRLPVGR